MVVHLYAVTKIKYELVEVWHIRISHYAFIRSSVRVRIIDVMYVSTYLDNDLLHLSLYREVRSKR